MEPRSGCLQEQFDLDQHCLSKSLLNIFADDESRRLVVIGALRVDKREVSVYTVMVLLKY